MTTTLDTIQIPNKTYYVLGSNWYCYVESTPDDREILSPEDLVTQLCTYAAEAFLGQRVNDTLTIINTESDLATGELITPPMIGVVMAICDLGDEKNDDAYVYVPSYKAVANLSQWVDAAKLQAEWIIFHAELEAKQKASAAAQKTQATTSGVKRFANSKPRFPVRYPASPTPNLPSPPPSGENPS